MSYVKKSSFSLESTWFGNIFIVVRLAVGVVVSNGYFILYPLVVIHDLWGSLFYVQYDTTMHPYMTSQRWLFGILLLYMNWKVLVRLVSWIPCTRCSILLAKERIHVSWYFDKILVLQTLSYFFIDDHTDKLLVGLFFQLQTLILSGVSSCHVC